MDYNIVVRRDTDGQYIARNLELGIVSQGYTIDEAITHIHEATELYLEDELDLSVPQQSLFRPAVLTTLRR